MKQEFQRSRQELISHIETSLAVLKQQRDTLLSQPSHSQPAQRVKISTYLQNEKGVNPSKQAKSNKPPLPARMIEDSEPVFTKKQIIDSRVSAKEKCEILKDLYERKKQMQMAGIYQNDPQKIRQFYGSQANVEKMKKSLATNKKKAEASLEKQKIIQEQLTKVESFLKQSKKPNKSMLSQSKYSYNQLLQDKKQRLNQYQLLINKSKLSIVQKDSLLQMTFDVLKQYPQMVPKKTLQQFLLANQNFCKVFYLTKEEIMRDLQVHKTQQPGFMNYQQYYEYIKSVEITNKAIKPNLNYPIKDAKKDLSKRTPAEIEQSNREKAFEDYIKKVFLYLDQKRQQIVQRQRIQIAFCKGLLYDDKKMKGINKESVMRFGQFIKNKRIVNGQKSYFKNLDMKYIGMDQLLQIYKTFQQETSKKGRFSSQDNGSQAPNESQAFEQPDQEPQQVVLFNPTMIQSQHEVPKETSLQQDFDTYGWQKKQNQPQHFAQLKQLDSYYRQMKDKYGNEIHWNNFKVYQQDFKKFNEGISQMKSKHQDPKVVTGLDIQFPVHEQQAQQYQDDDFDS